MDRAYDENPELSSLFICNTPGCRYVWTTTTRKYGSTSEPCPKCGKLTIFSKIVSIQFPNFSLNWPVRSNTAKKLSMEIVDLIIIFLSDTATSKRRLLINPQLIARCRQFQTTSKWILWINWKKKMWINMWMMKCEHFLVFGSIKLQMNIFWPSKSLNFELMLFMGAEKIKGDMCEQRRDFSRKICCLISI